MDPASLLTPSQARARTVSPSHQEPLSYHPDQASPVASPSSSPSAYQVEVFRAAQVQRVPEGVRPEPRVSVSMTMLEYQGSMNALHGEVSTARGLGREEGMRAMDVLATAI